MKNTIAYVLRIIAALVFLAAFIGGIVSGYQSSRIEFEFIGTVHRGNFNTGLMIAVWIGGFLSGLFFMAIAEIIQKLHEINENSSLVYELVREINQRVEVNKTESKSAKTLIKSDIVSHFSDEEEDKEFVEVKEQFKDYPIWKQETLTELYRQFKKGVYSKKEYESAKKTIINS